MEKSISQKLRRAYFIPLLSIALIMGLSMQMGMSAINKTALQSNHEIKTSIEQSSEQVLTEKTLELWSVFVSSKASELNIQISTFAGYLQTLAATAVSVYEEPSTSSQPLLTPGQLYAQGYREGAAFYHFPSVDITNRAAAHAELERFSGLDAALIASVRSFPNITDVYLSTELGNNIMYDSNALIKRNADYVDLRQRVWYKGAKESGKLFVSESYADAYTGQPALTLAMPIYSQNQFIGVVGIDISLTKVKDELGGSGTMSNGNGVVFSEKGKVVSISNLDVEHLDLEYYWGEQTPKLLETISEASSGSFSAVISGEPTYMVYATIPTTGWKFAMALPIEKILQPVKEASVAATAQIEQFQSTLSKTILRIALIMLVICLLVVAVSAMVVQRICSRISQPIHKLAQDAQALGAGELDYTADIKTGDEIETLSHALENMAQSIQGHIEQLTAATAKEERLNAELSVATGIQLDMLPQRLRHVPPHFAVDAFILPAKEMSGDFYDFFQPDENHLAIVIADVSDKGIPAALVMTVCKTLVKHALRTSASLARSLEQVNNELCENNQAGMFVTAWVGLLALDTGELQFVNAGHNYPLLGLIDGDFDYLRYRADLVLAIMENTVYHQQSITLRPGDTLFLYTDGVVEATSSDDKYYGDDRLQALLDSAQSRKPASLLELVRQDVTNFTSDAPQSDDITMLALTYLG